MQRITVTLSQRVWELLKIEAARSSGTVADELRRAADHYVERHASFSKNGVWKYLRPGTNPQDLFLEDGGFVHRSASILGGMLDGIPKHCGQCTEPFVPKAGDLHSMEARMSPQEIFICSYCVKALKIAWHQQQS